MVRAINAVASYEAPTIPYAPAAGEEGSTAVASSDPGIINWASELISVSFGEEVADEWKLPENLAAPLGPASANAEEVLVLGRGGSAILKMDPALTDGTGDDFVVFENAFRDTFLELALVEVSTDGVHFVRFPSYSLTPGPVPGFGSVDPSFVHGFAGKYRSGYGTPFDLSTLASAYAAALDGAGNFSGPYREHLVANFPHLDLHKVPFVRVVDVPGDGSVRDCEGYPVYDPYPTVITAGFDLHAIGVMNEALPGSESFVEWSLRLGLDPVKNEDRDGDNWSQYMEYLMGSDPMQKNSAPIQVLRIEPETGEIWLEYSRSLLAEGGLDFQVSWDGGSWASIHVEGELVSMQGAKLAREKILVQPVTDAVGLLVRILPVE